MHATRIAELLAPFLASPSARNQRRATNDALIHNISTYIDMLRRWNSRVNLTAIRDEEEIVTRHFGESLFAAIRLFPQSAEQGNVGTAAPGCPSERSSEAAATVLARRTSLADIGSGAGFPGIPIKLWAPQIALTLIESSQKKVAFLREICRALTLTDIDIFHGRAETLMQSQEAHPGTSRREVKPVFDVVTLRAVERFDKILPTASALLSPQGRLALLIGSSQQPQARSILTTLTWAEPVPIPRSTMRILCIAHR